VKTGKKGWREENRRKDVKKRGGKMGEEGRKIEKRGGKKRRKIEKDFRKI